ncbi:MAG: hypothetical protein COA42_01825 [Alteromonadaceae bacterium]|nr:MAG: hypothetical protein COA42_01825 [Alteromonadaceae bacterium]
MRSSQIFAGFSSIGQGLIYIIAFVYFGVFWAYPHGGDAAQVMSFLHDNQLILSAVTFLIYIVFGCLLAVLVVGINQRLKDKSAALIQVATLFGAIWVGLVVASGMISNIGLAFVVKIAAEDPEKAMEVWSIISLIVESLGGGNELIGGLWVLLLSIAAIKVKEFSLPLNCLGIIVGIAGISTVYPAEVLTEIFGVTQIVWFIWLGVVLIRKPDFSHTPN